MSPGEIIWRPSAEMVAGSNMSDFMVWLEKNRGKSFDGYEELWKWSTEDLVGFWSAIWDYNEVVASEPYREVLGSTSMPGAEWFPGARLNYAENIFRGHDDYECAIVYASESNGPREITWGELRSQVSTAAAGLRRLGVGPGDRVVAYLPNVPEAVVAFLASASIGAIWSSCSPDFGARTVIDRFAQIEPKVLIGVSGYRYGGKEFDRSEVLGDLADEIDSLTCTVVLPFPEDNPAEALPSHTISWNDLLDGPPAGDLVFEPRDFSDPLWVLYSSGTTGLPKAIVQSHGGILLEHLKTHKLHLDLHAGDRYLWFTTTGWMMWNFVVSGLLTKAAIVLYDGNPGFPDMGAMWKLVAEAGVTCFGTSASFIAACRDAGVIPSDSGDLSALRAIGSTGSTLAPEGFDWIYEQLGENTWLFSTSGGTDVCTAFIGGVPLLPVYRGELQGPSLGAKLQAFDETGQAVVGEVGELVITEPMPSMPIFFWGDNANMGRYRESYFETYPGVWRHGDWIELTDRHTGIIYGRSDSTINRGGIRMGTSEIYRAILTMPEILDALVVDIPRSGTEGWMPLFVVLEEGAVVDDDLRKRVARLIREYCSPRHVPNEIYVIEEVPRTLTGKILEVPVKRILTGTPLEKAASRDALANPRSLDYFAEFAAAL
ncbi:MAG: acetoacetate--CoA ligase [Solirubrobacterales bacterium]